MAVFPAGESISLVEVQEAYTYFKSYLYSLSNKYICCFQTLNKPINQYININQEQIKTRYNKENKNIYQVTFSQSENIKMKII